jgi:iron-sulfur cluster assembly protein
MTVRPADPPATMEPLVTVTASATAKLRELLTQAEGPDLLLRVYVTPGGCSGFSYGMELTDRPRDDDRVVEHEDLRMVVDPSSSEYLSGSEIDFIEEVMRSGFTVRNPNATSGCSCGQSFRTADEKGAARPCSH